jgi:serine/threonine protein kinase/tetratricopeptide (TPR) repeat protein
VTGQTVTHYQVAEKISEGVNAVVYRAEDLSLGREVVLKFVSPVGSDDVMRFLHEARTISSLNHPNICTIYEIGEHDGRYFLALERLEGEVLSKTIASHPLTTDRLIDIGTQIASALDAAHAARIVHRDLKPANIFVTSSGRIKLLDFGVALLLPRTKLLSSRQTTARTGTIPYMSPEQAQAEDLDHRSDLFSLGVVLYEMTTGRRPFPATTVSETLSAIVNRAPIAPHEINPLIPPALERIIAKALEKKPELRYQTASDLRADLQRLKRDLEGTAIVLPRSRQSQPGWRFAGWLTAAAALLAGAGWFWFTLGPSHRQPSLPARSADGSIDSASVAARPVQAAVVHLPSAPLAEAPKARQPERAPASAPPALPKRVESTDQVAIAKQQIELKLYDQAITTLRSLAHADNRKQAVDASFQIASIQELQGDIASAMGTYVEIATRFAGEPRAPEALFRLARATMGSKRTDSERDTLRTIDTLAARYPNSVWAPRALLMRGDLEHRGGAYQRDDVDGGVVPAAAITYRHIAERYPTSDAAPTALQKLAAIYVDKKRYASAAATYEALAAHDADGHYDAWFAAAEIYDRRLKDAARARAAYARVPPSSPHYAEALKRR